MLRLGVARGVLYAEIEAGLLWTADRARRVWVSINRAKENQSRVKTVLFACVHNAGRSQMAAAWFNELADPTKACGLSAGTDPASRVHPEVVDAMREVGLDLTHATPRKLTESVAREGHVLITMGCGEECPLVPGVRVEDWALQDPKGQPIETVRRIRDEIRMRVIDLIRRERLGLTEDQEKK